jgi:hypothetical protein
VFPFINQALAAERTAEFMRAAEAGRKARAARKAAHAARPLPVRHAHAAGRLPGQQAGAATTAGLLGPGRRNGASVYPARVAARSAARNATVADREGDQVGAAALSETRC